MPHYLFGYGSLINTESRHITGDTGHAIPVQVQSLLRGWHFPSHRSQHTAVSVHQQPGAVCNGVLVEIDPHELGKFDARERGYERTEIPRQQIANISEAPVPVGTIVTYILPQPRLPSVDAPIAQSYVDVILTGCLQIGPDFAEEFITATQGWEHPWINDREQPRYPRHLPQVLHAAQIDAMLHRLIPAAFQHRITPA